PPLNYRQETVLDRYLLSTCHLALIRCPSNKHYHSHPVRNVPHIPIRLLSAGAYPPILHRLPHPRKQPVPQDDPFCPLWSFEVLQDVASLHQGYTPTTSGSYLRSGFLPVWKIPQIREQACWGLRQGNLRRPVPVQRR